MWEVFEFFGFSGQILEILILGSSCIVQYLIEGPVKVISESNELENETYVSLRQARVGETAGDACQSSRSDTEFFGSARF